MSEDKNRKFLETLAEIDTLIKGANLALARTRLREALSQKIATEHRLALSRLCRRLNDPERGVILLNPVVCPSGRQLAIAEPDEIAEYAICLVRIGAVVEGLRFLQTLDKSQVPEAYYFEASAHIARWDYPSSIPMLEQYIAIPSLSDYQRLIGKVNLAGALVHEHENQKAKNLLREIENEIPKSNRLLKSTVLQFSAQLGIDEKDFDLAEFYLEKAEKLGAEAGGLYALFNEKWRAILSLYKKTDHGSRTAIKKVRQRAEKLRHWETVRDCDMYLAISTQNQELLERVYLGTPFSAFREHFQREVGRKIELPEVFEWSLKVGPNPVSIDLLMGGKTASKGRLKTGQLPYRLVRILSSDFYRPFRLAHLHAELFPEEHYNPISSPLKIHQLLHRTRLWMKKWEVPLQIVETDKAYSLSSTIPAILKIPFFETILLGDERLEDLQNHFEGWFTAKEAQKHLKISNSSALRVFKEGIRTGVLEKRGAGTATEYRLVRLIGEKKVA